MSCSFLCFPYTSSLCIANLSLHLLSLSEKTLFSSMMGNSKISRLRYSHEWSCSTFSSPQKHIIILELSISSLMPRSWGLGYTIMQIWFKNCPLFSMGKILLLTWNSSHFFETMLIFLSMESDEWKRVLRISIWESIRQISCSEKTYQFAGVQFSKSRRTVSNDDIVIEPIVFRVRHFFISSRMESMPRPQKDFFSRPRSVGMSEYLVNDEKKSQSTYRHWSYKNRQGLYLVFIVCSQLSPSFINFFSECFWSLDRILSDLDIIPEYYNRSFFASSLTETCLDLDIVIVVIEILVTFKTFLDEFGISVATCATRADFYSDEGHNYFY